MRARFALFSSILLACAGCSKEPAAEKPAAAPTSVKAGPATEKAPAGAATDIVAPKDTTAEPKVAKSEAAPVADAQKAEAQKADGEGSATAAEAAAAMEEAKKASGAGNKVDEAKAEAAQKVEEPKPQLAIVPPVPVKVPEGAAPTVPALGATPPAAGQGATNPVPGAAAMPTAAAPAHALAAAGVAAATKPVVALAGGPAVASTATYTPPPFQNVDETRGEIRAREAMVKMLQTGYRHAITDERVLKAMGTVPRHEYLLPENRGDGYKQMWFRIGHGQTITDPGMVAWMTQLLAIKPTDKVLEIGTGSGYQGSVLAQLTPNAFTIEIVEPLAQRTYKLLEKFGYDKVLKHRIGDGYYGWEEEAPFDKIIVTCAADHIPILLLQQLKPGGLMVIPVGPRYQPGKLHFVAKDAQGKVHKKVLGKVDFVPMTRLKDWGKKDDRDAKRKELEKQSRELKYEETP